MKTPTAPPVQNPAQLTPAEGQAQPPHNSTRVLLVEDNKEHQRLLQFMLARLGVHAVLAENGQQGFEAILGGDSATLILMDLHMPRFDGYGATEQIREVERKHGQARRAIIAVTAYTDPAVREHCLAIGMDDVLIKPVSFETVKAALARWLPKENLTD
jgi:CheY-like chemotaxis protein